MDAPGQGTATSNRERAASWPCHLARALWVPESSGAVDVAWRAVIDTLTQIAPSLSPRGGAVEWSAEEASVYQRGMGDLEPSPERAIRALSRSAASFALLLHTSLSTAEAARLLGVNESRIRQRLSDRTLYGLKDQDGWHLPRFQFMEGGAVPGIAAIFPHLPAAIDPVAVENWFTSPNWELVHRGKPLSPRDWLANGGDPADVAALARLL